MLRLPPCRMAIDLEMDKPTPKPSVLVVKKVLPTWPEVSALKPGPLSVTVMCAIPCSPQTRICNCRDAWPCVAWMALRSTFMKI